MFKRLTIFISALTCAITLSNFAFSQEAFAQTYKQPPVVKSQDMCRNEGKIYYMHKVLEKQTIYSISKAYEVSIEDIYNANPGLDLKNNGLKKDQIIFIPKLDSKKTKKEVTSEEKESVKEVENKPTKQIEKKSVASEEKEMSADEKWLDDNGVFDGKKKSKNASKTEAFDYFLHRVKWYDDLERISKKYGISQEILMKFNKMTSPKVVRKQKLKIPTNPEEVEKALLGLVEEKEATKKNKEDLNNLLSDISNDFDAWITSDSEKRKIEKRANAILMLPLGATEESYDKNYMDFYAGALLAVKDLTNEGISTDLSVYDVAGDSLKMTKHRLAQSDVAIGPIAYDKIEKMFEICPKGTNLISPLDQRAANLINKHNNFIQAPTSYYAQYHNLVKWLATDLEENDKTIIISEKHKALSLYKNSILTNLQNQHVDYEEFTYGILEGRSIQHQLKNLMNIDATNRVIIVSENEAFVNDVVRNLNLLLYNEYNVVLYSPAKFRSFRTIDVENFHKLNMHMCSAYYIDYDAKNVQEFLSKYRALFNAEPSRFAFQGYDTAYYFIKHFAKYGRNLENFIGSEKVSMLQSDYHFAMGQGGGIINTAVRRCVYKPDLSIEIVK